MAFGIVTSVERDGESLRVFWSLREDAEVSGGKPFAFSFDFPQGGSRAEVRQAILDIVQARIEPVVRAASSATTHLAAIQNNLVGYRWPPA